MKKKRQTEECCGLNELFVILFLIGHKLFDGTKQMDVGPWCQISIKILHYAKNKKII